MLVKLDVPSPVNSPGPAVAYIRPHRVRAADAHPDHRDRVAGLLGGGLHDLDTLTEVTCGDDGHELALNYASQRDQLVKEGFVGHHAWLSVVEFWHRGGSGRAPSGALVQEAMGTRRPGWVAAFPDEPGETPDDAAALSEQLATYFRSTVGEPGNVEDTHHTLFGGRLYLPGQHPPEFHDPTLRSDADRAGGATMLKTSSGFDLFSGSVFGDVVSTGGEAGTATGVSATTLTVSGATWTTNQWQGHFVVLGGLLAVVLSNTGTVLTLDQWYTPGSSDAAASTPSTGTYVILPGRAPARYMGISTGNPSAYSTFTPNSADTALPNEWTAAGGGLVRQRMTLARVAGSTTSTEQAIFTANGTDITAAGAHIPLNITGIGTGNSILSTGGMLYEDALPGTMSFNVSGDKGTITITTTES